MQDRDPTQPVDSSPPQAGGLFELVVSRPVAVLMIFLAALVFGWVSYQRLPIELMPDISYPTLTVRTVYEGAAPQEVESQVSRPVEEALATLDGLVSVESRSRAGASDVVLGFDWGTDMSAATQSVREALQTTWLPEGTQRPLLLRYDPSLEPFLRLALSIDTKAEGVPSSPEGQLFLLREIAEGELKRELEGLPGVAAVRVQGGLEREIHVAIREDWLAARGLTLDHVRQALAAENVNIAGGSVIEGDVEYLIRTLNEYTTAEELRYVGIRRDDGVRVPLIDVAEIRETHRERDVVSRLDGGEAVELEIFKEADANVVEVARRIQVALPGQGRPGTLRDAIPDGVRLDLLDNQAAFIEDAIDNLWGTAQLGGLLAISLLFLFLRDFRATAIIGAAIPVSVLVGFGPLYLLDVSLNLMSLGGLALGVGMLIDNAVVVLESIQRFREEGLSDRVAAVRGVQEVAGAVIASTLTTIAVFLPIAFVEGVAGELFGDLSVAVVSSLSASLLVALFLVPMTASLRLPTGRDVGDGLVGRLLAAPTPEGASRARTTAAALRHEVFADACADVRGGWAAVRERKRRVLKLPWVLARATIRACSRLVMAMSLLGFSVATTLSLGLSGRVLTPLTRLAMAAAGRFQEAYERLAIRYHGHVPSILRRPGRVIGTATALFVLSLMGSRLVGTELIPDLHQGRFTIETALPVGTPLARTSQVISEAEAIVMAHPEVLTVYASIGVDERADARADEGQHTARLRVQLAPGGDLSHREDRVMEELREQLAVIPNLETRMVRPSLFSFRTPVEVVVYGYDLEQLRAAGEEVVRRLEAVDGLRDVKSSLVRGHPEVQIHYDRERLHRLGLDAATVASRVRDKVQGVVATQIRQGDQRVALLVQLTEEDRSTLDDLREINVNPQLTPRIPLSAVASFDEAIGPSEIRRVDQQRAVVVSANLEGFDLGTAGGRIEAALASLDLADELTWTVAGQSKEMEESLGSLQFALGLAIFLVYVIMASTFENLLHPLVILLTVPLAVIGVTAALLLTGTRISVVVLIGAIVLAGVVVNNAIVLVDAINRRRAEGMQVIEAIAEAGRVRMRPILITTSTTVLGLVPLALGVGSGAEMQGPMAVTVIGGLTGGTILTLFVIPVVYAALASRGRPDEPESAVA